MRFKKNMVLALSLAVVMITGSSWGFLVHRTVTQLAVYQLPDPMRSFFYTNMGYLVKNSVRPDLRRNEDSTEAPKHFIDLEAFGDSAAWKMPVKWVDAIRQFRIDTFFKYGYVPYHIVQLKERLSHAFSIGNKDSILFYAADISHYIGDANVPLHTTLNYDGQLTNQKGLHSFWESTIPELELEQYSLYGRKKAVYLANPEAAIWNVIRKSYQLLPELFKQEKEVSKNFPDSLKFKIQMRNGREVKSYTTAFAKAYSLKLKPTINDQLKNSSDLIADFWFTAWVDAGKPDLKYLLPDSFGRNNKKALKKEMNANKKNQLIEQKLLKSRQESSSSQ